MKTCFHFPFVGAVSAAVWLSLAGAIAAPLTEPAQVRKPEAGPSGFDLQISGGQFIRAGTNALATLGNVIDALREQYTEANIVLSPGLGKLIVGDLKLRAGHLAEELEAVRVASGEKFEIRFPVDTGSPKYMNPTTGLPMEPSNAGLFVLREAPRPPEAQRLVEAFNIGPYLESLSRHASPEKKATPEQEGLNEIETMIEQTVADFKGGNAAADQLKWQYHRGATLLVVIGTPESVEIARKIVNALPGMDSARFGGGSLSRMPQQRSAEEAFRARYGLAPRSAEPGQTPPTANDPAKP
jgi:hypothetical protein